MSATLTDFRLRISGSHIAVFVVVAATIAAGIAALWPPARLEPLGAAFAAATSVIGLLPGLLLLMARERSPFPLFPLVGLFYSVFFGIAPLASDYAWPPPGPIIVFKKPLPTTNPEIFSTEACSTALLGLCLLLLGAWVGHKFLWKNVKPISLPKPPTVARIAFLAWATLLAHLSYIVLPQIKQVPSFGQLLDPLGYFSYGVLFVLWFQRKISFWQFALAGAFLCAEMLMQLSKAYITPALLMVIFLAGIRLRFTRRVPWASAIALVVISLAAYNVMAQLRFTTWNSSYDGNRIATFLQLSYDYLRGNQKALGANIPTAEAPLLKQLASGLQRLNLLVPLTVVVDNTPGKVEYWAGESYRNLAISFIPRALWPEKPLEQWGSEFGRRYHLLGEESQDTSFNLPWLVELYANFGRAGVIAGMIVIGLFLSALDRFFNSPAMSPIEGVYGATVIFKLFYQESNFSVMTGSLIPLAIILWVYLRVGLALPGWRSSRA